MSAGTDTKGTSKRRLLARLRPLADFTRSAWCMFGICLLFVAAFDLGLRLYFSIAEPDASLANGHLADLSTLEAVYGNAPWLNDLFREYTDLRMRWSPNVYWMAAPQKGHYVNVDSRGLRATWRGPASSRCTHPVKIFTFGGSTVFGYEVRDDYTIASWLQKLLDSSAYCTEVSNFGQDGYVSTQEMLTLLAQLRRGNRPDIVIFYDGWNDAAATVENGAAGLTFDEAARRQEFDITNPFLRRDRVRLYAAAAVMFGLHSGFGQAAKHIVKILAPTGFAQVKGQLVRMRATRPENLAIADSQRVARDVVQTYLRNKELIEDLGERFGFRCLFYWQPCVLTKRVLAPLERRQTEEFYAKQVGAAGTELFRDVYSEIESHAKQNGIVDLSDLFGNSGKLYYIDEVHLTEEGNRVAAQRMLPEVGALLSRRSAVGTRLPTLTLGNDPGQTD